eukprot:gene15850-17834_t
MELVSFWINEEFYSIGIFAFIGVLVRSAIYIDFNARDDPNATNSYGPFIQMFYTEPYLLPNLLGCFLMGLFYSYKDEINRSSKGLYKGFTTGFCGSLTSFSSWMFTAFKTPFTGDNWYKILVMIVLESLLTWMCLILGMSTGITIRDFFSLRHQTVNPSKEIEETSRSHASKDDFLGSNIIKMKSLSDAEQMPFLDSKPELSEQLLPREIHSNYCTEWWIWCLLFWVAALPLWITLFQLSDLPFFDPIHRREIFCAVCLSPFGAW